MVRSPARLACPAVAARYWLTAPNVSPAAGAFTGRNAARYGFTEVEIKKTEGAAGQYTNVEVVYRRKK